MSPTAVTGKMSRLCLTCCRAQIGPSVIVSSFQQLQTKTKYSTAYSFGKSGADSRLSDNCKMKRYSSTWNSQKPSELDHLTPIDKEKALFLIKRRMGAAHSKGTEGKILWLHFHIIRTTLYHIWELFMSVAATKFRCVNFTFLGN